MRELTQRSWTRSVRLLVWMAAFCVLGCGGSALRPVAVDPRNDACASCRMAVSDPKLAAEVIAAGEEPRVFDDIGCLAAYLREHHAPPDAAIFVADHRTGAWVPARSAVYTRAEQIDTPMGSHLVAHADPQSRDADGVTGTPIAAVELLGDPR